MLKLIGLVGTNSKRSTNRQLLQYMQKHFADKAEIELVEIKDIPIFNKPADKKLPAIVTEIAEKIECLRYLEYGMKIKMIETNFVGVGIDVPEDLEKAREILRRNQ